MKARILHFLTTFTQLTARLKNVLMGWLFVLSLKESLIECATVCIKSEVTLYSHIILKGGRYGIISAPSKVISTHCQIAMIIHRFSFKIENAHQRNNALLFVALHAGNHFLLSFFQLPRYIDK